MMASNILSRILPPGDGSPSIYETIRQHDEDSEGSDLEQRDGLMLDEQNLGEHPQELDLDHAQLTSSYTTTQNTGVRGRAREVRDNTTKSAKGVSRPRWVRQSHKLLDVEEADDDVPASLLIEGSEDAQVRKLPNLPPPPSFFPDPIPAIGNATNRTRQQWKNTQAQQGLHASTLQISSRRSDASHGLTALALADPKEKAMWRWANVENLDNFLQEVYLYFLDHGFWSTMLHRALNLVTLAFVIGFSYFLGACIDYRNIRGSNHMAEILIPRCASKMGAIANILLWLITFIWISKVFQYLVDIRRLWNMHEFFHHLLGVSDGEIQTISWQDIVSRLMALRDSNPNIATRKSPRARHYAGTQNKERLDAHDIANRLMRRENYMIAMVNKDILDLTLPVPFLRNRQLFSRTLEWNIHQCVMDYIFNERGQVRQLFLKDTHRKELSDGLRRRFLFAGTANLLLAPFLISYFLVQYFFNNFTEYQKNPAQIGSRQYNPLAEWKFREFNELWHLFQRRVNMSYPFATRYVNQFPKAKTIQTARFVAFISGALASVLAVASVIDPELFLGFEVTKDRTVLFYLSIFGTIWAIARGLLPDDNVVYDPEIALKEVIEFTHYKPHHWEGRLHSNEVRSEFVQLYQMKIVITLEEVLSMVFTPFVLWFSLPRCSDRIIDFFREFTVHVDGIGYVCSFAEFNFQKREGTAPVNLQRQASGSTNTNHAQGLRDDYYASKDQKLEASYWGFMNDYARNPKTDVRFPYPYAKRRHLPPPFPGLISPTLAANADNIGAFATGQKGSVLNSFTSPQRALGFQSGTPAFGAQNPSSPLTSMLLDPHHQPSALGFGSPQVLRPRSGPKYKGVKKPFDRTVEMEEQEENGDPNATLADQSGGELGSWKDEEEDDNSQSGEEDVHALAGEGGVLGLIRQFQMTHGETRPGGGGGVVVM